MQSQNSYKSIVLIFLLLASCFPVRDISTINMASRYRNVDQKFHPEFELYNINDTTLRLFIKFSPGELLFVRQNNDRFSASLQVNCELINSYESTKLIDSSSATFSFDLAERESIRVLSADMPVSSIGEFLLHIFLTDRNKEYTEDFYENFDNIAKPSRNDFLVTGTDGQPVFRNYLFPEDTVRIYYRDISIENLYCKYYHRDFALAYPPFSFDIRDEFNYKPDSVFTINPGTENDVVLPAEGFYHFQTDSSLKSGLTLFRFYSGFPDITSPKTMIEAVRYLTSKKEYEEMLESTNPKSVIDNFWLTHGGNEEKSRLLIKKYYGRVREANRYFSSYTEGWRTDRGMIYVIFGSPGTIYKSSQSESWIYGTPNSTLALNFFFIKVTNPFTDNDFQLSRSPTYESNWYRAVEIWRQGRAYNSFY